jgi:hypothetical protein
MKLKKQANGKTTVKMSKREWLDTGKKAGWIKVADITTEEILQRFPDMADSPFLNYVTYCIDIEDLESRARRTESRDLGDNERGINGMHLSICKRCQDRLAVEQKKHDEWIAWKEEHKRGEK